MVLKLNTVLELAGLPFLLLDSHLRIESFTAPIKELYKILPSDVGRSIDDLRSLADDDITPDVQMAMTGSETIDRDIVTRQGKRFTRRLSLVTQDPNIAGLPSVLIVYKQHNVEPFVQSSTVHAGAGADAHATALILEASHDLRQPLQAFALLQGLLRRSVEGERAGVLLDRLDSVLHHLTDTLDHLVEVHKIDTDALSLDRTTFPLGDVFVDLANEFADVAALQGTQIRIISSRLPVHSNRRLLHQLIRDLVQHALLHAPGGKVLIGCRRNLGIVSLEIWDNGPRSLEDNVRALGLRDHKDASGGQFGRPGLSVVRHLADYLGHKIKAWSRGNLLTMVAVELPCATSMSLAAEDRISTACFDDAPKAATIYLLESDEHVRALLRMALVDEGYDVQALLDLDETAKLSAQPGISCLIIADYRTVQALSHTNVISELGGIMWRRTPVIILTGDIPSEVQAAIDRLGLIQVKKPVQLDALCNIIQRLLPRAAFAVDTQGQLEDVPAPPPQSNILLPPDAHAELPVICVVDDDAAVCDAAGIVFEDAGFEVRRYANGEAFLSSLRPNQHICLLVDAGLPGISGLDVLVRFRQQNPRAPAIMITGSSDVAMAVRAMKAGAFDFIEKPAYPEDLLESVRRAIAAPRNDNVMPPERIAATEMMARLTRREQEIMRKVLEGHPSKNIAMDLGISKRTVENHRAAIMKKTGSNSLPALARLALNQ